MNILISQSEHSLPLRENFSEYVAELQLHMALQARKLVPTLQHTADSRHQLLHSTQAAIEMQISRQAL